MHRWSCAGGVVEDEAGGGFSVHGDGNETASIFAGSDSDSGNAKRLVEHSSIVAQRQAVVHYSQALFCWSLLVAEQ